MPRDDLLAGLEAQQRDECPRADADGEHRTVRKHGELHCNECGPLYTDV